MLLSRRLPKLTCRLNVLADLISGVGAQSAHEQVFAAERAIIQIQVEWEQFVRSIVLDSAIGEYYNSTGQVYSGAFSELRSREAAAHKLVSLYSRRRYEPDWYIPNDAIDAADRLAISNFADVAAELGQTPWPIEDLRYLRNFVAHRSKRSALNVRTAGLPNHGASIRVIEIATEYDPGGLKRYDTWINFIKGSALRLAK